MQNYYDIGGLTLLQAKFTPLPSEVGWMFARDALAEFCMWYFVAWLHIKTVTVDNLEIVITNDKPDGAMVK